MAKKINKKFVISQSILFIFIVGFITVFKSIFGEVNTLVGVTTITAILMFLRVDLTISPIKNTIKLLVFNVVPGLAAYLALLNPWIGIPINIVVIFIIGYNLYFSLKDSLYLPFTLQYVFMIATPVTSSELPMRLVSLLVAPIAIMLFQVSVNKNRITKKGNKILADVCDDLIEKINNIEEKVDYTEINNRIKSSINEFRKIVYDNRRDDFYLTEEGTIKVNLSVALEKLSVLLERHTNNEDEKKIILYLNKVLKEVKEALIENRDVDILNDSVIKELNENIIDKQSVVLHILNSIELIDSCFRELKKLGKENYNKVKGGQLPEKYRKLKIFKRDFSDKSVKFSYAVKSSIGISIAIFIADYFNISEGKWIYFTTWSLIIPIYELSKKKTKDRFFATVIGSISVVILFSIFKDSTIRGLILILSGYIRLYNDEYRYATIFNTISAIGAAALMGGQTVLSIKRIIFVILGSIIAMLVNKFILSVKIKEANEELQNMYINTIKDMLKEVYLTLTERKVTNEMKNLLLVTSMIEEKIAENNKALLTEIQEKSLRLERLLVINIFELQEIINKSKISEKDLLYIIKDLKLLLHFNKKNNMMLTIEKIDNHIENADNIYDKLILINIKEIFIELDYLSEHMKKTI